MNIPKWVVKDVQATENHELLLTFIDGKKGSFRFSSTTSQTDIRKAENIDFFLLLT